MDYNYSYEVEGGALGALLAVYILIMIAIYVVTVIGLWKMYVKAGRPGWAAIIPIYNWWVWVEMIGRPRWWFWALVASVLLSWIPVVGIILSILMFVLYLMGCLDMAKAFGRGAGHRHRSVARAVRLRADPRLRRRAVRRPRRRRHGRQLRCALRRRRRPPAVTPLRAAPPAPPAAPVTPAAAAAPAAPVTPPVTPARPHRLRRSPRTPPPCPRPRPCLLRLHRRMPPPRPPDARRPGASGAPPRGSAAASAAADVSAGRHLPTGRAGAALQPRPFLTRSTAPTRPDVDRMTRAIGYGHG